MKGEGNDVCLQCTGIRYSQILKYASSFSRPTHPSYTSPVYRTLYMLQAYIISRRRGSNDGDVPLI